MKNRPHILQLNPRHQSDPRASHGERSFPQIDQNYQSEKLPGGCGTPVKFHRPAFFEISNKYFADEAARSFLADTGVFAALILTSMLPIVNGLQAGATLIHSVGVL